MRCSSSRSLFEGMLDGALTSRTQAALRQHLEECRECSALYEKLRIVDGLLLQPRVPEPPTQFTQRLMSEIERLAPPRPAVVPLVPILASYLIVAWLGIALALAFDPNETMALLAALLSVSLNDVATILSFAHGMIHGLDASLSSLTAVSIGALVFDTIAGLALIAGYTALRRRSEAMR